MGMWFGSHKGHPMTDSRFSSIGLVCIALFGFGNHAPAQVKYQGKNAAERRQDERVKNQQQDVKKAQNEIKDDAKVLSAAQQKLRQAQARENQARHQLEESRKRVEAEQKASLKYDVALAEQAQAQEKFDNAKAPILDSLKSKPEYKAAQVRVAAAETRSKQIREDSSLAEDERKKSLAEATRDKLAVRDLENSALNSEPKLKRLRDNLETAHDDVARLHAKVKEAVESSSEVRSGLRALQSAMQQTAQAKAEVAKESSELAGDQAKLAKEQAQLDKAKLNDATHINTPSGRRPRVKKQ